MVSVGLVERGRVPQLETSADPRKEGGWHGVRMRGGEEGKGSHMFYFQCGYHLHAEMLIASVLAFSHYILSIFLILLNNLLNCNF